MSLQKLGKSDSPPVLVNGQAPGGLVVRGNAEKDPPPGFDLTKLAERAQQVKVERAAPAPQAPKKTKRSGRKNP